MFSKMLQKLSHFPVSLLGDSALTVCKASVSLPLTVRNVKWNTADNVLIVSSVRMRGVCL